MTFGRLAMGVLYVGAGLAHLARPQFFLAIVPDYLPAHRELVLVSGLAEVAAGIGVLVSPTRRLAAYGLVALLLCVFPANVWMAQHPERYPALPVWVLWARLPLQGVLIAWAWVYARPQSSLNAAA